MRYGDSMGLGEEGGGGGGGGGRGKFGACCGMVYSAKMKPRAGREKAQVKRYACVARTTPASSLAAFPLRARASRPRMRHEDLRLITRRVRLIYYRDEPTAHIHASNDYMDIKNFIAYHASSSSSSCPRSALSREQRSRQWSHPCASVRTAAACPVFLYAACHVCLKQCRQACISHNTKCPVQRHATNVVLLFQQENGRNV